MGNAGIRQEALDVALHKRQYVAANNGQDSDNQDHRQPVRPDREQDDIEDTREGYHCSGLGGHGHEACHGSGCAVVHIGRPRLEWYR